MKIKNIKKSGKNKYQIEFENSNSLKLYDNVILRHQILFKKEITEAFYEQLQIENEKEEVYYQTLEFVSKKIRCQSEVNDFLQKKDISFRERQRIINQFVERQLLNDNMYAKAYIQDRMLLSSDGPNEIYDYLVSRQISPDIVDLYIKEINEKDIYQKLEKLILKKIRNNSNKSKYTLEKKIMFDMLNLGYEKPMIEELLQIHLTNTSPEVVMKEYYKLYSKLSHKYKEEELKKMVYYKLKQKGFSSEELYSIKKI